MKNNKGLSSVVMMVIMIALVMAISTVVITTTKKNVEQKIKKSEACGVDNLEKLSINRNYVCYNSSGKEVIFSIDRKDIELDLLLVSIASETENQPFKIRNNIDENFEGKIISYPDRSNTIRLPIKNAGKTYIVTDFNDKPTNIQIAPLINGEQCDIIDSVNEIPDCSETTI